MIRTDRTIGGTSITPAGVVRSWLMPLLVGLTFLTGCGKSFDEAIKPVIDNTPDNDSARMYVTGTRPYNESDGNNILLNVWKVDPSHFPDSVLVYARVMDPQGNFISELAPPYYTGSEDYRKIWNGLNEQIGDNGPSFPISDYSVREFSDKDGIPFEISLALDYSGSMNSNIGFLENAAISFVNLKLPQDRISIVKFDNNPKLVVQPTSSKETILASYGKSGLAGFGGYTALYSAGKLGGEQVAAAPGDHPRALILFTDGDDNASTITQIDLYEFCRKNQIPVFAVAFGAVDRNGLLALASGTGGKFYQTNDPKELEAIFKDIYLSLRNYYLIRYKPAQYDGKHIATIALTPPGGGTAIGAEVVYTTSGNRIIPTTEDPVEIVRNDVFFAYNSSELRQEGLTVIRWYADQMIRNPNMQLEVRGHTDSVGTEAYNDTLSNRRALAVKEALVRMGVAEERVRARGFGERSPIDNNGTEEGRARNRRTEFIRLRQ